MAIPKYSAEQKLAIIEKVLQSRNEGSNVADACQSQGIHPSTFYRWMERLNGTGERYREALAPRSRRPKTLARETPQSLREQVIALATSGEFSSARAITEHLRRTNNVTITCSTTIKLLEQAGLYGYINIRRRGKTIKKRGLLI